MRHKKKCQGRSSIDSSANLMLQSYISQRSSLDISEMFYTFTIKRINSCFSKASFPRTLNLCQRTSLAEISLQRAWPPGNITNPLSRTFPEVVRSSKLVGIPSGYLVSYSTPPCQNSIFSIIFLVVSSKRASFPQLRGVNMRIFQRSSKSFASRILSAFLKAFLIKVEIIQTME